MAIKGYYKFNGNADDISGNNLHLTATNGSYKKGVSDTALEFPAAFTGYARNTTAYNFTTQDFTFSYWIYIYTFTTNVGVNSGIIPIYKDGWKVAGYYTFINGSQVDFYTCQTGALQSSSAAVTLELNKWCHITYARKGASVSICINGVNKTSTVGTHIDPKSTTTFFQLGGYGGNPDYRSNTKYDEFKVEDRCWGFAEIKNEYSRSKGFF